jgi:hypothetical protein
MSRTTLVLIPCRFHGHEFVVPTEKGFVASACPLEKLLHPTDPGTPVSDDTFWPRLHNSDGVFNLPSRFTVSVSLSSSELMQEKDVELIGVYCRNHC